MQKKDHYVIIGNGPAGNRAAEIFRENDKNARVTIISDEGFPFYYRYKLFDFLSGNITDDSLQVKKYLDYKKNNIRLRLGQTVTKIDPANRILFLKHMEKIGYTNLILATGGIRSIIPSLAGFEKYFSFMTSYNEALALKPVLDRIKKTIVIGGDLISIKFIKMLINMGKDVSFFLCKEGFWPIELTEKMSENIASRMEKEKIRTILDDYPVNIVQTGAGYEIITEKGKKIKGDIIFYFMGLKPDIAFIKGSGIDTAKGVLVDKYLKTNYKNIYACGDCAQIYNPEFKDYWISTGWDNATLQGETAALNLLGEHKIIKPVPQKILEVEGIKVNTSWWKEIQE